MGQFTTVNGGMQSGYRYQLVVPSGRNFDPAFQPELTPKQMLENWAPQRKTAVGQTTAAAAAMPRRAIWRLGV